MLLVIIRKNDANQQFNLKTKPLSFNQSEKIKTK